MRQDQTDALLSVSNLKKYYPLSRGFMRRSEGIRPGGGRGGYVHQPRGNPGTGRGERLREIDPRAARPPARRTHGRGDLISKPKPFVSAPQGDARPPAEDADHFPGPVFLPESPADRRPDHLRGTGHPSRGLSRPKAGPSPGTHGSRGATSRAGQPVPPTNSAAASGSA